MNIKKRIATTAMTALLIAPIGVGLTAFHTQLPTTVQAAQQNNLIAWNKKNGMSNNSADKEPRTNNPEQVEIIKGNPTKGFEFKLPGSNTIYAASATSPLAAQLRQLGHGQAGDNDGHGPKPKATTTGGSQTPKLKQPTNPSLNHSNSQPKANPSPKSQANPQPKQSQQPSKPYNHHKLTQTDESSTGAKSTIIGVGIAIIATISYVAAKKHKRTI